jgi:hypothetical protein
LAEMRERERREKERAKRVEFPTESAVRTGEVPP